MKSRMVLKTGLDDMVAPFAGAWIEIICQPTPQYRAFVAPFAGAWIEIRNSAFGGMLPHVAPFAGAWIEMPEMDAAIKLWGRSLPSRERGLKFDRYARRGIYVNVAPFAGAWIEIGNCFSGNGDDNVAPFAGAWIEIPLYHPSPYAPAGRSLRGSVD